MRTERALAAGRVSAGAVLFWYTNAAALAASRVSSTRDGSVAAAAAGLGSASSGVSRSSSTSQANWAAMSGCAVRWASRMAYAWARVGAGGSGPPR
jgi:hypothetical protein